MSIFFLLNATGRATPLSTLRFGALEVRLESAGLRNLGDLLTYDALDPRGLAGIPGLDPTERLQLEGRLTSLSKHINDDGDIVWDTYYKSVGDLVGEARHEDPLVVSQQPVDNQHASDEGARLVPSYEVTDGASFINAFPEVVRSIMESRDNEVDRAILLERLSCQSQDRKTLDEIASSLKVRLTRERVRQRESKLLNHLTDALLHGRQRRLGVAFRPSFARYWLLVAEQFGENEEISFTRFIETLESTWGVPADQLFVQLPFITSVLTSKAIPPRQMRAHMRRDNRIYRQLASVDRAIPITMLALGKAAGRLHALGIETVGDLFDAARNGNGLDASSNVGRVVEKVLFALVSSHGEDGKIDWRGYEAKLGLVRFPADPASAETFLSTLADDLATIIRANRYSLRAVDIFNIRIAAPRAQRLTLAQAAEQLGSHGPSIKREESIFLSALNAQLVGRDLTRSSVTFCSGYLHYWADAEECYRAASGDFQTFCAGVVSKWGIQPAQMVEAGEILWAVLNRYPRGRPPKMRNQRPRPDDTTAARESRGVVVLRGFRRAH